MIYLFYGAPLLERIYSETLDEYSQQPGGNTIALSDESKLTHK